jgi:hypothetical protein
MRAFRNRILAIGDRLRHLPAKDHIRLVAELRAALSELSAGQPQEELSAGQPQETARGCYKSGQT